VGVQLSGGDPAGQFRIVTFDDDAGSILGSPNIHDTTVDCLAAAFRFLRDPCDDPDHSGYAFGLRALPGHAARLGRPHSSSAGLARRGAALVGAAHRAE